MDLRLWLSGLRPKTLPASIAPVLVGTALAFRHIDQLGTCVDISPVPQECVANRAIAEPLQAHFWPVAILCMLVALFLQIAVNFANDYSDGVRGTDEGRDSAESESNAQANGRASKPQRLVASGVPPKHVLIAAGAAAALAAVCGLAAVIISQAWWLLAVGAASLIAGWFYTGGKHPYGYAGLGELAVFLFFGLAAVLGTEYALSSTIDTLAVAAAICCGLNAAMLLMVNNLRDIESDFKHGKRTLAVRMGRDHATTMLMVCCILAWALGLFLCMYLWMPWGGILLLSGIAVPIRMVSSVPKRQFRTALSDAGFQTLLFAIVAAISAIIA
ncbi:1,4-dihydroxy-2-naphthoate octaprenyltransferase [Bifidobacterium saguini DSM 23967]|uniref:1,4-dihydroxy-2-naphthoate octaprenyltransferase n=2 Tax=Bifidobacterium saguini TaxID=762210 RepID=A0A087DE65_9BIFI|nr:1,4-dihydroxy-2-naphthoate octaprenyltransferase [Bifidobacterium saguini]KFI93815.1 1,4-dihydroxy-2-naphthoate octaprenyltransferase [Bifidobacterium saguini DSM 23967]QTB91555.1 1,4-dihydroxy-2-naphthoate octaprenyltransferase [Bifidobacterium saguini]